MAVVPPTKPSLKIEKTFTYRGVARVFSNRYFFNGGTPASSVNWTTLADNVTTAEKAMLPSSGFTLQITGAWGYAAGSDVPVFSKTYALNCTLAIGSGTATPGDSALLVRYSTADRTSKNHPIYLFNYYHGVFGTSVTNADTVLAAQVAAAQTYANNWITGFSDGTLTATRTGPYGHTATAAFIHPKVHHRDFPGG